MVLEQAKNMGNPNEPPSLVKNRNSIIYREPNECPIFRLYIGMVSLSLLLLISPVIHYSLINDEKYERHPDLSARFSPCAYSMFHAYAAGTDAIIQTEGDNLRLSRALPMTRSFNYAGGSKHVTNIINVRSIQRADACCQPDFSMSNHPTTPMTYVLMIPKILRQILIGLGTFLYLTVGEQPILIVLLRIVPHETTWRLAKPDLC